MPESIIPLNETENDKVVKLQRRWRMNKKDTVRKIIRDYKEVRK